MKHKYPFQYISVDTKDKMDDILNIKQWLNHQLHIPALSDEFILLFLHSCYYSIERTKDTIDNYFTVRAQCSDLFKGRGDSKYLLQQLEYYDMMALPNLTPDKSRIVMYRLRNEDLSIFNYADTLRAFFAVNDLFISEDGLMEGYVVVFDMSGLSFGHLAKTTTQLNLVKNFMVYIQECHPVRLKSIHLHLHPSLDTLAEYFPLSILPSDYTGGQSDSVQVQREQTKKLVKKYASWLKDFEQFEANEKKRVGKPRKQMVGAELGGSFKTLSID
ncbi:hypothetical protein M8J76_004290 [Diaphorina citri]|nr:hypothetical protein M8J76_004290 [Diaphorina citri]